MSKPKCGSCCYFDFDGLRRACFHPDDARHLGDAGPADCKKYVECCTKGDWFPNKLTLAEFRQRIMQSNTEQVKER